MKQQFTMEDVYRDWDSKIAATLINGGVRYEDVDDLKGDIYESMERRNICSKFDPSRAKCFSTYVYRVIHSLMANYHRDINRKKRIPRELLRSVEDMDKKYLTDSLQLFNLLTEVERRDFIEKIILEIEQSEHNKVIYGIRGASLTLKEAVILLFQGQSLKDIADLIGVKTQRIKESFQNLKSLKSLREYLPQNA